MAVHVAGHLGHLGCEIDRLRGLRHRGLSVVSESWKEVVVQSTEVRVSGFGSLHFEFKLKCTVSTWKRIEDASSRSENAPIETN